MIRSVTAAVALSLLAFAASAAPAGPKAGDVFEITRYLETSQQGTDGSSGSSVDGDAILERVVRTSAAGVELEYDLSADADQDERSSQWQLPARMLKPADGPLQLLNRPELEARAKAWRKAAELPDEACGRWAFTWTAFKIECDPQSAVDIVEGFDLGPDGLTEGAPYRDPMGIAAAPLKRQAGAKGLVLSVELAVDPEVVRKQTAETDVVVGELTRKPVTLEQALAARSGEVISGAIAITFEIGDDGRVRRQVKVTKISVKRPDGVSEIRTSTLTLERRRVS